MASSDQIMALCTLFIIMNARLSLDKALITQWKFKAVRIRTFRSRWRKTKTLVKQQQAVLLGLYLTSWGLLHQMSTHAWNLRWWHLATRWCTLYPVWSKTDSIYYSKIIHIQWDLQSHKLCAFILRKKQGWHDIHITFGNACTLMLKVRCIPYKKLRDLAVSA